MNREELEYKIKLQANALKEKDEMLSNRYSVITYLSQENTNLKKSLNQIREYISKDIQKCTYGQVLKYQEILQILDKVLGDEK